jgi:hypothetical protein
LFVKLSNNFQIAASEARVLARDDDFQMSTVIAQIIRELKARLCESKNEIQFVQESEDQLMETATEVDALLAHYAECHVFPIVSKEIEN